MGRTTVQPKNRPRARKKVNKMAIVAIIAVLLFALIGVVSAGSFLTDKMAGSSKPAARHGTPGTSPSTTLATENLARAQAQASAIVQKAQLDGHAIVSQETTKAHRQARSILNTAQRQASKIQHQAAVTPVSPPVAVAQPAATPIPVYPATNGYTGQPIAQNPGSAGNQSVGTPGTTVGHGSASTAAGSATTPNLSTVPASWLVVGYNASFGSGPGNAGSISVINRSGKLFSGVARVAYTSGGFASAPFSGLAPGQSITLPLNGAAYHGGGYHILLMGVH